MSSEPVSAALRLLSCVAFASTVLAASAMAQDFVPPDDGGVAPPVDVPVETPNDIPVNVHNSAPSEASTFHESLPGAIPSFGVEASIFGTDRSDRVQPLDEALAANIAASISATNTFCSSLPESYLVDCMAERLDWIATTLPAGRENDEIRDVLKNASRSIERVARENRDRSQPRIRAKTPGPSPVSTSRPLVAVRPEAQAAAVAETAAILEEASQLLLRSSARSQQIAEQYRTVAEALDSSALLLRS